MLVEKISTPLSRLQKLGWRRSHQGDHIGEMSASHVFPLLRVPAVKQMLALEKVPDLII